MEDGTIMLVGATTENPSFELNCALLSRARVLVLNRLDDGSVEELLVRAEEDEGRPLPLDDDARDALMCAWPTATAAPCSTSPRRSSRAVAAGTPLDRDA